MSDIDVRLATTQDLPVLASLMLASNEFYWGKSCEAAGMTAASAGAIIDGRSGCKAVIAWIDGSPTAFATISLLHPAQNENGTLFMKDLFVLKAARGSGVGKRVMLYLAQMAHQLGCKRFDWTAELDNPDAISFYRALGADRVEEKVYFRFGEAALNGLAKEGFNRR